MRRSLLILVLVALVFGAPYAAAMMYRAIGPWRTVAVERDGSRTRMEFDQNLPRPDFLPVYPGATIVQASQVTAVAAPGGFFALDLAARASLDDVRHFYTAALAAHGFAVRDVGTWPLNAAAARLLGMDDTLIARRATTDDQVDVQIRTPEGLIPARMIQIHWRKISELPRTPLPPEIKGF